MQFCQAFNAATQDKSGTIIPVEITIYEDKTFDFVCKTPPAAFLIKEKLGLKSASGIPQLKKVGELSVEQLREIAEIKMPDLKQTTSRRNGDRSWYRSFHGRNYRRPCS